MGCLTEGRVAKPDRRWGCRRGTPVQPTTAAAHLQHSFSALTADFLMQSLEWPHATRATSERGTNMQTSHVPAFVVTAYAMSPIYLGLRPSRRQLNRT